MSVSEQERHELYIAVESAIGTEGAARLMDLLPPTGWADVTRKSDLNSLEARLSERIESQGNKLRAEFYKSQESQTRLIIFSLVSAIAVVAALAFGAVTLD